jgi:hypothetical protein
MVAPFRIQTRRSKDRAEAIQHSRVTPGSGAKGQNSTGSNDSAAKNTKRISVQANVGFIGVKHSGRS